MRTKFGTVLAAACGICGATLLTIPSTAFADTPLAETSSAVGYSIDTFASPRAVKTAEELAGIANGTWKATRRSGEMVTLTAPDGTVATLAAADSSATSVTLPLDAGGVWIIQNSKQGASTITVRRSLDGTLGEGTAASPARLVDGDELCDYGASANYTFVLDDVEGLLGSLRLPLGYCMEAAGDGMWRLIASEGGCLYKSATISYVADSKQEGPYRRTNRRDALPVAYSGDNWTGDATAAATLTFTSPDGISTVLERTGTGTVPFTFNRPGTWMVRLEMASGTTLDAELSVIGGLTLVVR